MVNHYAYRQTILLLGKKEYGEIKKMCHLQSVVFVSYEAI